jgi:hypothetical protein
MSSWGLNKKPTFAPNAVATERGWEAPLPGTNPDDGLLEVIVAIRQLETKRRDFIDGETSQLIIDEIGGSNFFLTLSPDDGDRPSYLVLVE